MTANNKKQRLHQSRRHSKKNRLEMRKSKQKATRPLRKVRSMMVGNEKTDWPVQSNMMYNSTRVINGKGEKISVCIDGNEGTICSQSLPSGKVIVQKCTKTQALKKIEQLKVTDRMPKFPDLPRILINF